MGMYVIPVRAKHWAESEVSPSTGSDRWRTERDSLVPPLLRRGEVQKDGERNQELCWRVESAPCLMTLFEPRDSRMLTEKTEPKIEALTHLYRRVCVGITAVFQSLQTI